MNETANRRAGPWTFEELAAADRSTLEEVLRAGSAPDFDQLDGHVYRGWNHSWVSLISGRKFKKGFRPRDGRQFGYNEICRQDRRGLEGDWEVKMRHGRPVQLGYFRVSRVEAEPPGGVYDRYRHLGHLSYGVTENRGHRIFFRAVRDFVALPNPGDHGLLLCKAYLQLGFRRLCLFYCYFLLGHPRPIEHEPW